MQFFINGQKLNITLDGSETISSVFEGINSWCENSGFVINKIMINEKYEFYSVDEKIFDTFKNKDDIKDVHIEAISNFEYAYGSFIDIVDYVRRLASADVDNNINVADIVIGANMVIDGIPRTTFLLGATLEKYDIIGEIKIFEARIERLKEFENNKEAAIKCFINDVQPFLRDTFLKILLDILDDVEIALLMSISSDITANNALYRIGTLSSFIEPLTHVIDDIVSYIQIGDDRQGFIKIEKFSKSIEVIFSIISKVLNVYELKYEDITYNGEGFVSFIEEINSHMTAIVEAFDNNDYVTVADILEYEVKEKIDSLGNYMAIIEKTIGIKIGAS